VVFSGKLAQNGGNLGIFVKIYFAAGKGCVIVASANNSAAHCGGFGIIGWLYFRK
jgi:hypothetical protein